MDQPADPAFTLRPATAADGAFLYQVWVASRERELAPLPDAMRDLIARQQYDMHVAGTAAEFPGADLFVIEGSLDGDIAPVGRLVRAERPGEVWIVDLSVMPDRRNAGIGGAVLRAAMAEVTERGLVLKGSCTPYNPARRLYARLGIVELPAVGAYIPLEWRPPARRAP